MEKTSDSHSLKPPTDEYKRSTFGEYPNDEEASSQIEIDMDTRDRFQYTEPRN